MAALYCAYHFNQPLGETAGSFFGGYVLGTIALYRCDIVGGDWIQVGIAAMRDPAALIALGEFR